MTEQSEGIPAVRAPASRTEMGSGGAAPEAAMTEQSVAPTVSGEAEARHGAPIDRRAEWDRMRAEHLADRADRPASTARGVHHMAMLSSDVERTIHFYQDLLGFPLTELFENRDYQGSTHFFFDIGHGNTLAFFDFPGLELGPYAEVLGGAHHLAISVERSQWERLRGRLIDAGVELHEVADASLYFRGPDGERLELLSDPLGEMYGYPVT